LPTGFTINSAARTWAFDGTGGISTGTLTLIETLAGATNTPLPTLINYTISLSSTISPVTIAFLSGYAAGSAITALDVSNIVLSGAGQVQAGNYLMLEWVSGTTPATNSDGTYSTSSQTVNYLQHLISEDEVTTAEDGTGNMRFNLTADPWLSSAGGAGSVPTGTGRLHAYIMRGDLTTLSPMSNQLSFAISASIAKFNTAVGTHSPTLIFSNGNLTIKGNATNGFTQFAPATTLRPASAASEFDVTLVAGTSGGNIWIGLDDGSRDLSTNLNYGAGVIDSLGVGFRVNLGQTVISTWRNSGTNVDYACSTITSTDKIGIKPDDSGAAGTHTIRITKNGTLVATMTGLTISSYRRMYAGSDSDETLTANYGATTLQDGGPIYG
jgi:hypothetical protein